MNARARIGGGGRAAVVAILALGVPFERGLEARPLSAASGVESSDRNAVEVAASPTRASQTASPSASAAPTLAEELRQFAAELERFRGGDASVVASLTARIERLATRYGRDEGRQVLAFYSQLGVADRKRGLETEILFRQIWTEVDSAGRAKMRPEVWNTLRPRIFERLQAILDASQNAPDFSPAARALALRSRLLQERIAMDADLDATTKARWIQMSRAGAQLSIALFERIGLLTPKLEPLAVLADLAYAEDHWSEAEDGYEEVLQIARHVTNPEYESRALRGLLRLARESGDLQRTSMLSNEFAAVSSPEGSWLIAKNYGEFLLNIDEPGRAADYLVRNKPGTATDVAEWHVLLGGVLARLGENGAANAHFRALVDDSRGAPAPGTAAWAADAERLLREKKPLEALAVLDLKPDVDKIGLVLGSGVLRIRGAALLELGDPKAAAAALESALRAGDAADTRLAGLQNDSSSVIGETVGLETVALLARARVELGDPLSAALAIEDQQSRSLRGAIAGTKPPALTREDLIAWSNICELGFVTWVVGADSTVVVHVARGGEARGAQLQFGRKALEDAVRRLREAAIANDAAQCQRLAIEIQGALLPPSILERVPGSSAADGARMLVCAHGPLERLPFDLLPLFGDGTARRIVPVVLPGILERAPGSAPDRKQLADWSIVGNPVDAQGVTQLAGARRELDSLAALHPAARVVSAREFDRAALLDALASKRALHIATHLRADAVQTGAQQGVRDARFARAGFELSRGDLFDADEIRRAHPALPLAVLSACATGSGQFIDAEASLGVTRAFLESGTRNLLVTLWPVEDGAARDYALAFHKALAAGKSPSRAAQAARDELRDSGTPMADWAAFRLVGRD
jgi:hypothetical protein